MRCLMPRARFRVYDYVNVMMINTITRIEIYRPISRLQWWFSPYLIVTSDSLQCKNCSPLDCLSCKLNRVESFVTFIS